MKKLGCSSLSKNSKFKTPSFIIKNHLNHHLTFQETANPLKPPSTPQYKNKSKNQINIEN